MDSNRVRYLCCRFDVEFWLSCQHASKQSNICCRVLLPKEFEVFFGWRASRICELSDQVIDGLFFLRSEVNQLFDFEVFQWLLRVSSLRFAENFTNLLARRHILDFIPGQREWREIPHAIVEHARLRFPKGDAALRYNVLQKLAYLSVIVAFPVLVLAGLTMSPAIDATFPWLVGLFGGRQSARTIHFILAFYLVGFVVVHLVMVVVSGFLNNMISMITGRYKIEEETHA